MEPSAETYPKTDVESPNPKEDMSSLMVRPSSSSNEVKDVQENLKVIDQRLLHMERQLSIVIPLLNKISEVKRGGTGNKLLGAGGEE